MLAQDELNSFWSCFLLAHHKVETVLAHFHAMLPQKALTEKAMKGAAVTQTAIYKWVAVSIGMMRRIALTVTLATAPAILIGCGGGSMAATPTASGVIGFVVAGAITGVVIALTVTR